MVITITIVFQGFIKFYVPNYGAPPCNENVASQNFQVMEVSEVMGDPGSPIVQFGDFPRVAIES